MKNAGLLIIGLFLSLSGILAQSPGTDLSAQALFEKVIHYYDPAGIWDNYRGSMLLLNIQADQLKKEELTIDNAADLYQSAEMHEEDKFIRGVRASKPFFKINGKELAAEAVPAQYQEGPYQMNENFARMMNEHHRVHFSPVLVLQEAGAEPHSEVGTANLFGVECLTLKFPGLPGNYKPGGYNGAITLYIDPAGDYRLHAMLLENGWWKEQKGMLNLYSGEIEVAGLKVPARRLLFHAADHSYGFIDVLEPIGQKDH